MPKVIIGNKIDLQKRDVTKNEATDFAEKNNCPYYETSAKTGEGVDFAIKELVKTIMNNDGKKNGKDVLRLSVNKKGGKCC